MDSGQVMEKRSVSVGFALPAKKMIRLLPGSTLASVKAPPNGSTRSIQIRDGHAVADPCGSCG